MNAPLDPAALARVSLDDKYTLHAGRVFLTGTQALVRLPMLQRERDLAAGLNTAGYIPGVNPANVQEYLDFGLHGFAMSRYSGCWIGFKCVTDVVESGSSVDIEPNRITSIIPSDFALPPGGVSIRWPDAFLEQEA